MKSLFSLRVRTAIFIFLYVSLVAYSQTKEEQEVLKVFNRKFEWLITKQTDSLNVMLDDRLIYIHSNGYAQSKQDVIDDLLSEKLIYKNVKINEAEVRVYSNTALVTGKGKFTGVINDNNFEVGLLFTEVYVLQNKKWILASRHANKLP
ncbi:MAG: nuclear transport factor 2 family protein [Cyclobacteriaceae bacterium]|nr:nuclear transport factor 2 family protein [Cyclobacteriaceae bacterium]